MIISPSFVIWTSAMILVLTIVLIALAIVVYVCVSQVNEMRGRLRRAEQEQLRSNRGYSSIVSLATESKESAEKAAVASESCSKNLAFMYGEMINLCTEVKRWAHKPKHEAEEPAAAGEQK